ncbi:putative AC transposase [Bienertia sinuspersici]
MENFYEPDFDPHGPPLQEEQQLENVGSTTARSVTIDMPHASFSIIKGKDGKLVRYATCIHCHVTKYIADPKYGTSNAKKHLDLCDAYQAYLAANPLPTPEFDQKVFCRMFTDAIMYFPPPHRGVDIYLFVVGLIKEWNLEGKTFSMTCDTAGSMDVMVARLKSDLQTFGTLPLGGRFFHVRCCAHILNLIVQSGMKVIDASILKVPETVNYIAGSDNRLVLFEKCVVDSKSNFVDYPTTNLYFRNIVAIEKLLVVAHTHTVASIQSMATDMMEKFEKYWSDYSVLLAIAVLLDPRYKMHFVKTASGKLYVHAEVESQASTFPVISRMAKDVLVVPITSVASESHSVWVECFEVMKEVQPDDIDFDSSLWRSSSCDNVNSSFFKGSGPAVADQWVFVSAQCLPVKLTFYWIYATLVAVTIDGLILLALFDTFALFLMDSMVDIITALW